MNYNIHYDTSAILILVFTLYCIFIKKDMKKLQNKIFLLIIVTSLAAVIFDILTAFVSRSPADYSSFTRNFVNYCYLMLHMSTSYFFSLYVLAVTGICFKMNRKRHSLLIIPFLFSYTLVILNPVFKWVFYFDEKLVYTYGPMIYGMYACAYFYIVYSIVIMLVYRHSITKQRLFSLYAFMVIGTTGIILQLLFPNMLLELFAQSIAYLGLLFTIENEDEITNSITKVYNRNAIISEISTSLSSRLNMCVITVKLSDPTYFNTTLGVLLMNKIMLQAAQWLKNLYAKADVYDCENCHFALIIFNPEKETINKLSQKIKERFSQEWVCENINIILPVQVFVSYIPENADTLEKSLIIIDTPYYASHEKTESTYEKELLKYQRELAVEAAINKAAQNNLFKVYYQPIFCREKSRVVSCEALLRLFDSDLGFIAPDEFIPVAEKNGLIVEIGAFVLDNACKFINECDHFELGIEYVEVNLSVIQCMHRNLVPMFENIINTNSVDPSRINLEITESAAANSSENLQNSINGLRELGFSFSIDDYGTGYSNISYLYEMPFDIVKLDKSILWTAMKNPKAMITLKNTVKMLKELNLAIVVEGIETSEQRDLLFKLECNYLQGYFYSKPVEKDLFFEICREIAESEKKVI